MSKSFGVLVIIFTIILTLQSTAVYGLETSISYRAAMWFVSVILFVNIWYVQLWALGYFRQRYQLKFTVFSVFLHILPVVGLVSLTQWGTAKIFTEPGIWNSMIWWYFFKNFVIALVFEFFVVVWIYPPAKDRSAQAEATHRDLTPGAVNGDDTPQPDDPDAIWVGNTHYRLDSILFLKSAEHYVEIVTRSTRDMARATISDIIKPLPDSAGLRTHRSYWVSKSAIMRHQIRDGSHYIVLTDGSEIPVSRHRRLAVQAWLTKYPTR